MKKVMAITIAVMLIMSFNAFSQDFQGLMKAGGYLGYTIGTGDAFDIVDPGFNFGGTFHYGITDRLMVGGELGFQSYSIDFGTVDDSETKLNVLGSILYGMGYEDGQGLLLTAGIGNYGGIDAIGINGGIVYCYPVSDGSIQLIGMPRIHYVFEDGSPLMITLSVGALFDFGGGY